MTRNVTSDAVDPRERFCLYRLCECTSCGGTGKAWFVFEERTGRCPACRGEGRTLQEVATCGPDPAEIGVALYTLALEGEWDDGCPFGLLDRIPEPGNPKWLVTPWRPSPRNVSDAARTLRQAQKGRS